MAISVQTDMATPALGEFGTDAQKAEFDALWDTSPEARDAFIAAFAAGVPVESSIVAGVGHSIDHHLLGVVVQLRQLAFALEVAGPS